MAFDLSKLREGDIITVKCQVKYAPQDDSVYVSLNGYVTANIPKRDVDRLVCEKLIVGQTVWDGRFKVPMPKGEVLFLTDEKALVRWEDGNDDLAPRRYLLRDDPNAAEPQPAETSHVEG